LQNYYQLLHLSQDATQEQVKAAYRRLAKKYHPDVNPDDPQAQEHFKRIAEAYRVLSDPQLRWRYDNPQQAAQKDFEHVWQNTYFHKKAKYYKRRRDRGYYRTSDTGQTFRQLAALLCAFVVMVYAWWPNPPKKQSVSNNGKPLFSVEMAYQECQDLTIEQKTMTVKLKTDFNTKRLLESAIGNDLQGLLKEAQELMQQREYRRAVDLYLTIWLNERYFPPLPKTRDYVKLAYEHLPFIEQDRVVNELREKGFAELAAFLCDADLAKS